MEFISISKKFFNTIHANTYGFYEELHAVVEREPTSLWAPEMRGLFSAIGIQKGKPFAPDARMKKILTEAVAIGNATARAIYFRPNLEGAYQYPDNQWYDSFVGGDYQWLIDGGKGGRNLDARTLFFYHATLNTPAMVKKMIGLGSQYASASTDKNGDYLDGSKTYKLNIPANPPAKDFWSVVVYDPQTRSELQTDQPIPRNAGKRINSVMVMKPVFARKMPSVKTLFGKRLWTYGFSWDHSGLVLFLCFSAVDASIDFGD